MRSSPAVVLCLLLPLHALAAEPWEGAPFSAEPAALARAAAALPAPQGADVHVLLEEASFSYDGEGRETTSWRLVYRLLTPEGARSWASISATWSPWYEERPTVEARVISPEGRAHPFDPATLSEAGSEPSVPETYSDQRVLRAPLPAIAVGAIVEQLVVSRESQPALPGGSARRFLLGKTAPTYKQRLLLEAPSALPLRFQVRGASLQPARSTQGSRQRLSFEHGPLPARPLPEPYLPPEVVGWPHVAFSTGRSWTDVARGYHQVVESQLQGVDLARQAAEAVGSEKHREAVVARLLAWVHSQTRYTGLYLGAAAIVPRSPYETLMRGYGDCKDLSTLLVALLRARGIAAHVALVRTSPEDVAEELPGFGLFDHALVHIPGKPELWVDATTPYYAPGMLPPTVQGRLALVARADTRALVRLPESPPQATSLVSEREVFLPARGLSRWVERREMTGATAAWYRELLARTEPSRMREGFVDYVRGTFGGELVRVEQQGEGSPEQPLRLELEVKEAGRGYTDEREAVVGLSPLALLGRLPPLLVRQLEPGSPGSPEEEGEAPAGARQQPLLLPESYVGELHYRLVPPPGFVPKPLPEDFEHPLGPATLRGAYAQEGAQVRASFRFDVGRRRWSAEEVNAFRSELEQVQAKLEATVSFEHEGAAHLGAGRVAQGLEVYRRLAVQHPQQALHRARLALALLQAGVGEEARAEARRAVELEPGSALAWRALGQVLQYDALGRRFSRGFDYAGAVAALRKAKALEPQEAHTRAELALLLEHDERGQRHGPSARLEEALAEYSALRSELGRREMEDWHMRALFAAGRYAQVLELDADRSPSRLRDGLRVAAVALTKGLEEALRAAARWRSQPEERRAALESASQRLLELRRYPEARALLAEAARGAPNAGELQGRVSMLGKLSPVVEADLKDEDPRSAVQRLVLAALDPEATPEQRRALFARALVEGSPGDVDRLVEQLRRQLRSQELPHRVLGDVVVRLMELRVEGNERLGWRLRSRLPLSGAATEASWYVVKEGGKPRLLAAGGAAALLGSEALRRVEAGDLEGARQWLDWAREALPARLAEEQSGAGFLRLWPKGARAEAEAMRLAAASLAAYSPQGAKAVGVLRPAWRRAQAEARRALARDLAAAYGQAEQWEEMRKVAEELSAELPEEQGAFLLLAQALQGLKRYEELAKAAQARLERVEEEPLALAVWAEAESQRGRHAQAQAVRRRQVEAGTAPATTYNELAWTALFLQPLEPAALEEALEHSQRSNSMTDYGSSAHVHTLATLYAELGRGPEARQLLLKSLELEDREEPLPHDWYVLGRIAEAYGLLESARKMYEKALSDKPGPLDTDALARARLAELKGRVP